MGKPTKYKFRVYKNTKNEEISIFIYNNSLRNNFIFQGKMTDENIFDCMVGSKTSDTKVTFFKRFEKSNTRYVKLSGSLKEETASFTALLTKGSESRFTWAVRKKPSELTLTRILIVEHLRKYGKFYGKQQKVFGRDYEGS